MTIMTQFYWYWKKLSIAQPGVFCLQDEDTSHGNSSFCLQTLSVSPFPQIDIIGAVVIVWRVRGKTIRPVLCNIVCNNCAQFDAHTYEQTNSSLDWVLSHWAHFTVLGFIFVLCITVCCIFYSARNARIASAVLATAIPSVRPSVCLSVARRYCVKTTARSTMQFSPLDSKMCLVL